MKKRKRKGRKRTKRRIVEGRGKSTEGEEKEGRGG